MAAVTIFSDFGAPQNKVSLLLRQYVSYCFHCFPILSCNAHKALLQHCSLEIVVNWQQEGAPCDKP